MDTFDRVRVTIRCVDLDGDGQFDYQHVIELGDNSTCRELKAMPPYSEWEIREAAISAASTFVRAIRRLREWEAAPPPEPSEKDK